MVGKTAAPTKRRIVGDKNRPMAINKKPNPTVLTVVEVAKILRIGKISAYQAIERGEVPSIRIGRRILIPRFALEQLLTRPSAPKQKADVLR
jgi:excisionase family DNA binding protein